MVDAAITSSKLNRLHSVFSARANRDDHQSETYGIIETMVCFNAMKVDPMETETICSLR